MGIRTWKYVTIGAGGTPQPLMGTFTAAAITGSPNAQAVAFSDASQLAVGDRIMVDGGSATLKELTTITAISSNNVTAVFNNTHATSAPVHLFWPCTFVYCQGLDGNAAALFIGNKQAMVKATGVGVILKIVNVTSGNQPTEFSSSNVYGANPDNTANYWIDGTTGDSYLPSCTMT